MKTTNDTLPLTDELTVSALTLHAARSGIAVGLAGAGAVVAVHTAADVLAGQLFYTPTLLGSLVFLGEAIPASESPRMGLVVGYTLFHFGAFAAVGNFAATQMALWRRRVDASFLAVLAAVAMFFGFEGFTGMLAWVAEGSGSQFAFWSSSLTLSNLLAAGVMGLTLYAYREEG